MRERWTAEADRRLLLAYVATNKSPSKDVCAKWKELYSGQNIAQRSERGIEGRITKLKESVGISPKRSKKQRPSAADVKQGASASSSLGDMNARSAASVVYFEADRDDSERAVSVKREAPEVINDDEGIIASSVVPPKNLENSGPSGESRNSRGKGKQIQDSSSEASMSEGEGDDEVVYLETEIKDEDDDFHMPQFDDEENVTPSPTRVQQSRQAKIKPGRFAQLTDDSDFPEYLGDDKSVTVVRSPSPPATVNLDIGDTIKVSRREEARQSGRSGSLYAQPHLRAARSGPASPLLTNEGAVLSAHSSKRGYCPVRGSGPNPTVKRTKTSPR